MIKFHTQPAPTLPESVLLALKSEHPLIWLRWNPRAVQVSEDEWEGRWDVYVRLEANTHEKNRFARSRKDVWHDGAMYRFLQTWREQDSQGRDAGFAPIDSRFIRALYLADTFRNRRWYEDNVLEPEEKAERKSREVMREAMRDSYNYYKNIDNPTFGAYTKGDWRHRIR